MPKSVSEPVLIKFNLPHQPSPAVPEIVFGESLTEQNHKDSCDINLIVARAQHNPALLLDKSMRPDVFRDFSNSESYVEMLNKVCEAKSAFEELDSSVRSRFDNDPSKLIDFVTNPDNALEAHDLGLLDLDKASLDALTADEPASPLPASKKPDLEPDKAPEPKANTQLPT